VDEQTKSHPIWEVIEQLKGLKGDPAFTESAGDAQTFSSSQRIFQFSSLVEQRLLQAPASLLSPTVLTQLHSALTSARNEVTNFIANKNIGHLANAVSQIDAAGIPYLAQIPLVGEAPGGETLAKIADEFGNQIQGMLKAVLVERGKLQQEYERLLAQMGRLEAQAQTLGEAVAKQQAEAMNVVQAVQTSYSAKEQQLQKVFDASIAAQTKSHDLLVEKHTTEATADRAAAKAAQDKLIVELEERLAHAKKIVGIIGNIGVTGNYQKTAQDEGAAADLWRRVTLGAFAVAVISGGIALFLAHQADFKLTVARMLFAFLVLGVTVYTGKESARHRSNADRAKRVELELASLGPFVESLDKPKQDALREKLTSEYFGKEAEPHSTTPAIDPNSLVDLLKTAIGKLSK
jgi:hypothetical protein